MAKRKVLTDENLWRELKERWRTWPAFQREARIEYLKDIHADALKAEAQKETQKEAPRKPPAQEMHQPSLVE